MAGNTELVDEIIDLAAVEKQKRATLDALKEIKMAINEFGKLEITAKTPNNGFAATIKNLQEINKASEQYQKVLNNEAKVRLASARVAKAEADAAAKIALAKKNEAAARKASAQAAQQEQKGQQQAAQTAEKEDRARTKANNANREAVRAYKSLVREYNILRKVAEDYGASLGTNSRQYIEAAKRANELNDRLKAIDKGIGNSQRNVGNYASGFNGLGNSINQITRELPAFTNSVQTGFLAISNNLPILFDEIGRTRQQIVELRKAGEPAPSLFKAIAGSFFSLGTALSLGVTALTIFGPQIVKFVQSIFQGTQALNRFAESQRLLGEAIKESGISDAAKSVSELKINIDLAKQGLLDKEKVLKQYNESIGKTTGEVKSLDEAEQALVKNGDAYIKMMLLKAAAQLALEEASKKALQAEIDRTKREANFLTTFDKIETGTALAQTLIAPIFNTPKLEQDIKNQGKVRKEAAIKQSEEDSKVLTDIAADFQKKAAEIAKQFNFDFFGGTDDSKGGANDRLKTIRQQLFTRELEDFRDQLKALADSEQLSVRARQKFRQEAADIDRKILEETAAFEIQLEKDKLNDVLNDKDSSKNARINAQREYAVAGQDIERNLAFDLIKTNRETEFALLKIKAEGNKAILEEEKKFLEELNAQNQKAAETQLTNEGQRLERATSLIATDANILIAAENKKLATLEKARAKGRISDDVYVAEKKKIETRISEIQLQAQVNSLKAELTYAERILSIRKSLGEDTVEAEKEIARIRREISGLEAQQAGNDPEKERIDRLKQAYKDLANELRNTFAAVLNGIFEKQKNEIQDQIDLIEKRKQKEIEAINATTLSEQQKADAIKILEARAAAQREQLELKQRQVQQRQARFQKALTIAEITADTAAAIVKQLKTTPLPFGAPLVALIAATGAAKLAAVLATPIPRYKDGTDNHPGGLAIVGDGGRREVAVTQQGDIFTTSAFPSLVNLPRGTQVYKSEKDFTDATLAKTLSPLGQLPGIQLDNSNMEKLMEKQVKKLDGITNAIKNQPHPVGPTKIRTGQSFVDYVNKNVRN